MVLHAALGKVIPLFELQPLPLYSWMKPFRTHLHKHEYLTIQIQIMMIPPKQLIKLHHFTPLHSYRPFATPAEVSGTVRAHSSVTTTWPKVASGVTAEQWHFAELKQSRNTSQITCRRWCKAPALHSSHRGIRAMAPVSRDLSTTSDWPCQAALCPREHPLPHDLAQIFPCYLINPCFSVSRTRNLRDGQFHCVKLANNWI